MQLRGDQPVVAETGKLRRDLGWWPVQRLGQRLGHEGLAHPELDLLEGGSDPPLAQIGYLSDFGSVVRRLEQGGQDRDHLIALAGSLQPVEVLGNAGKAHSSPPSNIRTDWAAMRDGRSQMPGR